MTNNELSVLRDIIEREHGMIDLVIIDAIYCAFGKIDEDSRDFYANLIKELWRRDENGKSIYVLTDSLQEFMSDKNIDRYKLENKIHDKLLDVGDILERLDYLY